MDLADILKKTQAKSERVTTTRKPPSIATEDRPYSIADSKLFQPIFDQTSNELQNVFNSGAEGTVNPLVTQNALWNHENSIKEIDNETATNRQQTDNKPETNRQQTDNKAETKSQQPVDKAGLKNENRKQSGNQTGNTIGNKVATNRKQTENKVATKTAFSELVGLQRNILILVCHECKNSRSRTTEALTLEYLSVSLKCSPSVIKTTIQRLEKKGCLLRVAFKNGRGGWSKYELPDSVYHDVLRSETANKPTTNWQQTENKPATKLATEPTTSTSSSSSFLNIKETTTKLDDEWNFDITPYAKFGFMTSQLKQLASLGIISAVEVEQSLLEFNHDLDNNALPQMNKGKLNFLMGILRKGQPYISDSYRNEEEAIISEMATRAESRRKKILEDKFVVWETSLNDEERKKIEDKIPLPLRVMLRAHGVSNLEVKNWLFNYYLQSTT
jgi:hypothetical protein